MDQIWSRKLGNNELETKITFQKVYFDTFEKKTTYIHTISPMKRIFFGSNCTWSMHSTFLKNAFHKFHRWWMSPHGLPISKRIDPFLNKNINSRVIVMNTISYVIDLRSS